MVRTHIWRVGTESKIKEIMDWQREKRGRPRIRKKLERDDTRLKGGNGRNNEEGKNNTRNVCRQEG